MVAIKFPPYFAGAAVQAVHLAKDLERRGVAVQFITDNDNRPSSHDTYEGLKVFRFSTFLARDSKFKELIYVTRIAAYVLANRCNFDVIHFHSMRGLEFIVFPLCKLLGKKIVLKVTLMDNDDPVAFSKRKMGSLILWGQSFIDRFAVISTGLKAKCLEAGTAEEKVCIIYNGVNTERYFVPSVSEKSELKERLGFGRYSKVFLSIGQIEHRKGYDLLIEAWAKLSAAYPGSALAIAGPGASDANPYYKYLQARIAQLNVSDVFFTGHLTNSAEYVRMADCFLFCSRAEGFGTVLVEAMACGVPTSAMNIPGVTEDIIRDQRIGHISYSRAPETFAQETITFLNSLTPHSIEEASAIVRESFGIEKISRNYIELYESILNSSERNAVVLRNDQLAANEKN